MARNRHSSSIDVPYITAALLFLTAALSLGSVQPSLRWTGQIVVVVALLVALVRSGRTEASTLPPSLPWWMLGWTALQWALIARSPLPIPGTDRVAMFTAGLMFFFLVVESMRHGFTERVWISALITVALSLAAIEILLGSLWLIRYLQVSLPLPSPLPFGYRATGLVLGHPNALSGFLNLALIAVLSRCLDSSGKARWTWGAVLAAILAAQWLTSSRAGLLAGILGVLAYLAVAFRSRWGAPWAPRVWGLAADFARRNARGLAAVLVAILLGGTLFAYQAVFGPGHRESISGRLVIWDTAIRGFLESPWIGHGPGSFSPLYVVAAKVPPGFVTSHAHSAVLQVLVESGIVGLVVVGAMALIVLRGAYTRFRSGGMPGIHTQGMYVGVGVAAVAHQAVDYLFESSPYLIGFLVMVALTQGNASRPGIRARGRAWSRVVPVLIGLSSTVGLVWSGRGSFEFWNGVTEARRGALRTAATQVCTAAALAPEDTFYAFQCALAEAQADGGVPDSEAWPWVDRMTVEALARDPFWAIHWANRAAMQAANGDHQEALASLAEAISRAPDLAVLWMNQGAMQEAVGLRASAADSYEQALRLDPWLALRPFFRETDARDQVRRTFDPSGSLDAADLKTWQGWEALQAGRLDQAEGLFRESFQQAAGRSRNLTGLALLAAEQNRWEEAKEWLAAAQFTDPNSVDVHAVTAVVLAGLGQEDEAGIQARLVRDGDRGLGYSAMYYARAYLRFPLPFEFVDSFETPGPLVDPLPQSAARHQGAYVRTR